MIENFIKSFCLITFALVAPITLPAGGIQKSLSCNKFTNNANYNIQRFKGLGEMMPKQLWDTTMNPKTRMMKRVEIEDALEADRIFNILMGDKVAPRRDFIETHSSNLDMATLDI